MSDEYNRKKSNGRDYEVGKGRPPEHTRWPPGRSGNPAGKKKGVLDTKTLIMTVETALLQSIGAIRGRDGVERDANALELAIVTLSKAGRQGDRRANIDVINLAFQIAKLKEDATPSPGSVEEDVEILRELIAAEKKREGESEGDDESRFDGKDGKNEQDH